MALNKEEERLLRPIHAKNTSLTNRLALSLWRQANVQAARGQNSEAVSNLKNAVALLEKLVALEPGNRPWQIRLIMSKLRLLEIQPADVETESKLRMLQNLLVEMRAMEEKDPKNNKFAAQVSRLRQAQAQFYIHLNKRDEAARVLDEALVTYERIHHSSQRDDAMISYYAEALIDRSELANASGRSRQDYCTQASEILSPFMTNTTDYVLLALSVRAGICQGKIESTFKAQEKLAQMSYREPHYLKSVLSHPQRKGNL